MGSWRGRSRRAAVALLVGLSACAGEPAGAPPPETVYSIEEPWPEAALLPPSTGPRLAVSNAGEDTISILDADALVELARLPVGKNPVDLEGPQRLAPSADGRFLYVTLSNTPALHPDGPHGDHGVAEGAGGAGGEGGAVRAPAPDGYVVKLDLASGRQVAQLRVGPSPTDLRLDGDRLYVGHFELPADPAAPAATRLEVLRAGPLELDRELEVCPALGGLALAPAARELYAACYLDDAIGIVDLASDAVRRVGLGPPMPGAAPPSYGPYAVATSAAGALWVSAISGDRRGLYRLDPGSGEPARWVFVPGSPLRGELTASGSHLYLATFEPHELVEIDAAAAAAARRRALVELGCERPQAAALSPDEARVLVLCHAEAADAPGLLLALDRETLEPLGSAEVGVAPEAVAWLPAPR